jgi:hypothetical protein
MGGYAKVNEKITHFLKEQIVPGDHGKLNGALRIGVFTNEFYSNAVFY